MFGAFAAGAETEQPEMRYVGNFARISAASQTQIRVDYYSRAKP